MSTPEARSSTQEARSSTQETRSNTPPVEAAMDEASAFLHDLEGFVLGFRSLGELLGWDPGQIDSLVALGDRVLAAGRVPDALTIFEGVLALDPRRAFVYGRLALCHHAGGDPSRALACLSAARDHFGDQPELTELAEALRTPS